jgi:hypothetical protein
MAPPMTFVVGNLMGAFLCESCLCPSVRVSVRVFVYLTVCVCVFDGTDFESHNHVHRTSDSDHLSTNGQIIYS